jgi:hypothetical protein
MYELIDTGLYPDTFVNGPASVFVKDGMAYVTLFTWIMVGGQECKQVVSRLVMPSAVCPAEWLRLQNCLTNHGSAQEIEAPRH